MASSPDILLFAQNTPADPHTLHAIGGTALPHYIAPHSPDFTTLAGEYINDGDVAPGAEIYLPALPQEKPSDVARKQLIAESAAQEAARRKAAQKQQNPQGQQEQSEQNK